MGGPTGTFQPSRAARSRGCCRAPRESAQASTAGSGSCGKADEARAAAAQFAKLTPDSGFGPTLDAILALDRKDYAAAESALANVKDSDLRW